METFSIKNNLFPFIILRFSELFFLNVKTKRILNSLQGCPYNKITSLHGTSFNYWVSTLDIIVKEENKNQSSLLSNFNKV